MAVLWNPILTDNAVRALRARYLRKNEQGEVVETPAEMFRRVAQTVAAAELRHGASRRQALHLERAFYVMMAGGRFLPNSPTLMNAGRSLGMLSACFVLPVEDSLEAIFESVKEAAQIQKAGGGTGFSFDRLRPTGDYISSSGGRTSGPISFWRVFSEATRAIQQGAFRRGANMGMLSVTHPDILKFVTAKQAPSAFENFNVSIKVPDSFMQSLRSDPLAAHAVVNPRTGKSYLLPRDVDIPRYELGDLFDASSPPPGPCYSRRDVWDMIVDAAWATGEPGLCFIDRVNMDNPTPQLGRIEATNPCGEQPLLDYEACNLGSINLAKFVRDGALDERALRQTIRLSVRFLDDVVDVNNYVVPQIERSCLGNRKIGLGVMGLADAMFELGIKYDSDAGLSFGRRVAEILTEEAFLASQRLADRRGAFPNFAASIWSSRGRPMRNAAVTTVAPTGTLSIIAGCSGGIEPVFALAFFRHVLGGQEMLEVNGPFRRYAQRRGFWRDELVQRLARGEHLRHAPGVPPEALDLFVTAHDVAGENHVRMQAVFQRYIDGAISKTINLPSSAQPAEVEAVFNLAYDLGCKGVTVYRDRCRQGQPMALHWVGATCPHCRAPLAENSGCVRCPSCGTALCT